MPIGKRYLIVKKQKQNGQKAEEMKEKNCLKGELNPIHLHAKSSHRLLRHIVKFQLGRSNYCQSLKLFPVKFWW